MAASRISTELTDISHGAVFRAISSFLLSVGLLAVRSAGYGRFRRRRVSQMSTAPQNHSAHRSGQGRRIQRS